MTDASLRAERAASDATTDRGAAHERRLLDDLIERDRFFADERLMKFRERADRVLARERSESRSSDADEARERVVADEVKQAEREATDDLIERERGRVDARTEERRRQQDLDRAARRAHRQDTDASLVAERSDADANLAALDRIESALADSRSEHSRRAEVLAMVTHDLRSPLTVIAANADFIAKGRADDSTREAAEDVLRAAARMERLLADLLDVARIESGTFRVGKGRHDVSALLAEVLHEYGPLFVDRDVTLKVDMPAAPLVASFDHDRVVQVISNLLGNAMKFTPPRGVVHLHAERGAADVVLVVRDTGPGIHPEALPHVFERFWKRDDEARRGLGLGLYICRTIAEAHGGDITVESDLGKGSTFRVSLPAA